jgi:hypothetical protein
VEDQFGVVEVLSDDGPEPVVRSPEVRIGDDAYLQPGSSRNGPIITPVGKKTSIFWHLRRGERLSV